MPLIQGASDAAKSANIRQLIKGDGKPQDQAVAIAMDIAKRSKRAEGGIGLPKLEVRPPMPSMQTRLHIGPIHSGVAGRTDHLPMNVPNKAYVLPADIVSGFGQGNTIAGFRIAKQLPDIFHRMLYGSSSGATAYGQPAAAPYGHGLPAGHAKGGAPAEAEDEEGVPIVAAGGEHVYSPQEVAKFGNGDVDLGHDVLDAFVKQYRGELVKTLKKLPGPKRD
jgi:hypothetical protein